MNYPISNPGAGARISATVKWYSPAKAYGFLVPENGAPDIYCRDTALAAVGLDTLLAGATLVCETVRGQRGPEVSRILSVDFSTASPRTASSARAPGNGRMADGPGIDRACPAEAGRHDRGAGQMVPADQGLRLPGARGRLAGRVLPYQRRRGVPAGTRCPRAVVVTCEIVPGDRGPQVLRILSVEPPETGYDPADRSQPFDAGYPGPRRPALSRRRTWICRARSSSSTRCAASVSLCRTAGGREVFVHSSVLFRSGMTDLEPGQRVFVRAESVPRGLQATEIEPI